jgi:hypothetical protein
VLPFLGETQAPVSGDRCGSVGDTKDRDDFINHAGMVPRAWDNGPARGHGLPVGGLIDELDRLAAKVDQLPGPATHLCTWTVT